MKPRNIQSYTFGVLEKEPSTFVVVGLAGPLDPVNIAIYSEEELGTILRRGGANDEQIADLIANARKHPMK